MKLLLDLDALCSVADAAGMAVAATGGTPETAALHLEAVADRLTATGFDGVTWATASCRAAVTVPGRVLIPAHDLRRWLKALDGGDVHLSVGPQLVRLDCGDVRQDWAVLDPVGYPMPRQPDAAGGTYEAPAAAVRRALDRAVAGCRDQGAQSETQGRFEGGLVTFAVKDGAADAVCVFPEGMSVAAVDGAACRGAGQEAVPRRALPALLAGLGSGDAAVAVGRTAVVVTSPDREAGCRVAAGRQPPWREYVAHMGGQLGPGVALDPAAVLRGARQATAAASGWQRLRLAFAPDLLVLSVRGRSEVKVPVPGCEIRDSFDLGSENVLKFFAEASRAGDPVELAVAVKAGVPQAVRLAQPGWAYFCMCLVEGAK